MIEPDEIYGLHVAPMETGLVSTKSGNVFAHARRISVSFDGTDDSAKITRLVNEIVNGLTRVKDKLKFYDIYNIIDPGIGIGSPNTIYENYVAFYGAPTSEIHGNELKFGTEVYVTDRQDLDRVVKQLKQKIEETGYKDKLRSINYVDEREGVNNDVNLVESSITTLRNLFGEHIVSENYGQMPLASEDFGHFQRKIPGVYFFLGASNQTLGISAFPHMPNFSVDETSIQIGVRYFSSLLFERVSNKYHDSEFLDEGLKNTE